MKLRVLICLLLVSAVSFQLTAGVKKTEKKKNYDFEMNSQTELDKAVMSLLPKKSTLVHSITQGVFGPADGTKGGNINIIYSTSGKTPAIMVLTPVEKDKYKKLKPAVITFPNAKNIEIMSVFFDQADKDTQRELFILCSATIKGQTGYYTAVFDWAKNEFKRLPKIEAQLKGAYPAAKVRKALSSTRK